MRRRKTIPLVPPDRLIRSAPETLRRARVAAGLPDPNVCYTDESLRLYRVRGVFLDRADRHVLVIGSVGGDGKIRDLRGRPVRVFDPPAGKDGAA